MRVKEFALGFPTILLLIAFAWANQSYASNHLPEVDALTLPSTHKLPSSSIARLEDNLGGRSSNPESGLFDTNHNLLSIFKRLNALQQEVQELRGQLEEQDYLIKKLQANVALGHNQNMSKGEQSALPKAKSAAISSFSFDSSTEDSTNNKQPVESSFAPQRVESDIPEPIIDEKQAYDEAFSLIQARDYKNAEASFNALLAAYPHGEYAANAYYWLGEVYSVQGNLELAKHSFQMVVDKFGFHHKAPDAKLKLGFVEHKLGDYKMAKQHLESIVVEHPGSVTARLAKVRLNEMKNDGTI